MRAPPLTPLADRRAQGQRQVRAAGLRAGGRAPYGLVLIRILVAGRPRTTLALGDRREVATLRAIARLLHRLGGDDPRAVAQALNAQGHRRRGRRWTAQDVRRALATTAYARWVPGWPRSRSDAEAVAMGGDGAATAGRRSASKVEDRAATLTQPFRVMRGDGGDGSGGDEAFKAGIRAVGLTQPCEDVGGGDGGDGGDEARDRASKAMNRVARLTQPSELAGGDAGRRASQERSSKAANRAPGLTQPWEVACGDGVRRDSPERASKALNRPPNLKQPWEVMGGDSLVRRLRCGRCGCTMRQRVTSARLGTPRRYLACTSGDRGRPCGARWWRREALEGLPCGELGQDQSGPIEVGEAGVSFAPTTRGARPAPTDDGLLNRVGALSAQLDRVELHLATLAEAKQPTESLLERVTRALENMEALSAAKGEAAATGGDGDEERGGEEGLGALTALMVAALRALVMLVPELPVTSTIAAKILGIQRAKLDGGGVEMTPLGRALVAPFGLWLARGLLLVPPPPGLHQLVSVGERGGGTSTRRTGRRGDGETGRGSRIW